MEIKVTRIGRYNLVNVDGMSAFNMAIVSPEVEKENLVANYESYFSNGEESLKMFYENLNLKQIDCLNDYQYELTEGKGSYSFFLPVTHDRLSEIRFVRLDDNEKKQFQDNEKYNIYVIQDRIKVLNVPNLSFSPWYPQTVLLVPLERNEKEYIEEVISEALIEMYYRNPFDRFENHLFASRALREQFSFYGCLVQVQLG